MKKLQIIILAAILAFIVVGSISHSYANAETVWRGSNQFAVVSTSKYVVFNISNVTIINFPKNAQDIDIAIYATVGVLNSSHILKVKTFLCGPHSKRAFFVISPQGSRDIILNSTISYGHLNHWNVVLCENDMCSRPLEIGFILKNVTLTGTTVYIDHAYAVLESNSANMSLLVPEKNLAYLVVTFTENGKRVVKNFTFVSNTNGKKFNVSSGSTNSTNVGRDLLLTWILLLILLPTIAFMFSDGLLRRKGRTAAFSLVGAILGILGLIGVLALSNIISIVLIITAMCIMMYVIWRTQQILDTLRALLISFGVTLLIIGNVALLLRVGVNPGDFAILIWVFSVLFGAGITFVLIRARASGIVGGVFFIFIVILILEVSMISPTYGLTLMGLMGYGLVFVQALIKTTVGRGGSNDILDTFYNLIIGAFIVPSSIIFADAIANGIGLSNASNIIEVIQEQFRYVALLYLGVTLTSVLLLWEESQENSMLARFLTLQNVIAMLLIVLGIGGGGLLNINNINNTIARVVYSAELSIGLFALVVSQIGNVTGRRRIFLGILFFIAIIVFYYLS